MNRFKGGINLNNNINFNIELIIDEYSNYVFKIINNVVGTSLPYQDKEEIASDAFYLLWKNQNKISSDIKSYLGVVTRNCCYSRMRKEKSFVELKENLYLDEKINIDEILTIKQKIQKLNEKEKELFILYYVDGYKIREIAKMLKMSISSIKIRLYRIRKKLKEEIL